MLVHLRETGGRRGLVVILALSALWGCALARKGPPPPAAPAEIGTDRSPAELRETLAKMAGRADAEAFLARARIYARLRSLGEPDAFDLLARGDAEDVELMGRAASPEMKAESASRLSAHFHERARNPALRRSSLSGELCEPLHRMVLSWIAAMHGEYLKPEEGADRLEALAESARALAAFPGLRPSAQSDLGGRAEAWGRRAAELRAGVASPEAMRPARRFCELDLARHLEEATRAAEFGAREKVGRGEEGRVIEYCLEAMAHFVLVQECLADPTPAQRNALAMKEVVVRVLSDLLCREP